MELYYKDLISEEASLEKLVDDLALVVQGVEEFAQAAKAQLEPSRQQELASRLQTLKERCRRVKQRLLAGGMAAGKAVRAYPYYSAGFAFALGLLGGILLGRKRRLHRCS